MKPIRREALSATFIALTLAAGCTADAGGYGRDPSPVAPQQALGSAVEALDEAAPLPEHLSTEAIQTVVRGGFTQYAACYEGLLAEDSTAWGTISLKFTIDPEGSMLETTVGSAEGALVDADFQECILSATETLVFPAAQENTGVVYPILMTPCDES